MSAIGLIIGNGYAKAWCDGRQTRFSAVAALWSATGYASVTGRRPDAESNTFAASQGQKDTPIPYVKRHSLLDFIY